MNDEKSKSQLKREAQALQELGRQLVGLSTAQLDQIPLPDNIREAIVQTQRIKSHGAQKRQIQWIGSLLRNTIEIEPIQKAYEKIRAGADLTSAHFHLVEQWRARLLNEGKTALTQFLQEYSCEDTQKLRLLVRQAITERDHQKNLGSSKALFRFIRDIIE